MQQHTVTLLLSGVVKHQLPDGLWPTMPAFQTLLSKGTEEAINRDIVAHLFQLFHLPVESGCDLPVGAISALGDGLDASSGWWMRADPVHMVADRDQLYLSAADTLGVSQSEADALVAELNELYAEDGWQFYAVTPQRWYLRLPQRRAMRTTPTAVAMGSRVGEVLPQGDDALVWQRVMTEIQMQLHASPVNAQRSEKGLLDVNSLWFWGGGELPSAASHTDFDLVISTDPLTQGMARLCGIDTLTEETPTVVAKGSQVLWHTVMTSAERNESDLFAPLLTMLRDGMTAELLIDIPDFGRWRIDRKALRRWWRRRRPLAALLKRKA